MTEQTKFPVGTRVRTKYGAGYVISRAMYREAWGIAPMIRNPANIVAYVIHDNGQIDCTDVIGFEKWQEAPVEEQPAPNETGSRILQLVKDDPNAAINVLLEMVVELFSVQAGITELLYPLARNHAHVTEQIAGEPAEKQRKLNELAVYAALLAETTEKAPETK